MRLEDIVIDIRRKRLFFRAWHRGMRELDLILGSYAEQKISQMTGDELDEFEKILSYEDRDLIGWLSGQVAIPRDVDSPMLRAIVSAHENLAR